ncbi:MAG: FG-GAP repeat protein [Akkermansiaceae bacterium]|nr:FG-GAP repeat protein [Akkermansiaceae bacterium]MCP5551244.1 FG-GAP repeat protein [Akkermansiaceae bacterium]
MKTQASLVPGALAVLGRFARFSVVALLAMAAVSPARAFNPVINKLYPPGNGDRTTNQFGNAVAVSDRFILVGEPHDDTLAENAGAVHVYDARTGRYLRKLTATNGAEDDHFGSSVALCGSMAIVGAPDEDERGAEAGAVYIFDVTKGTQRMKRTAGDGAAGDNFGNSVALFGNTAIVGAPRVGSDVGAAYVFDIRIDGPTTRLEGDDATSDRWFGSTVAICGPIAAVGASNDDHGGVNRGAVYLFDWTTGTQLKKLTASDEQNADFFGVELALEGNTLLVSSVRLGAGVRGAVYVFEVNTGTELGQLLPEDPVDNDQFGTRVALCGNLALVGTPFKNNADDPGAVYAFDVATRTQLAKIVAPDGAALDSFGIDVALCANMAVFGAVGDSLHGQASGAAYTWRFPAGPLQLNPVAAGGDFAPGIVEGDYASFTDAFVNGEGEALWCANLTGPGAPRGKNKGLFHTLNPGLSVDLGAQTGVTDLGGGLMAVKFGPYVMNRPDEGIFQATVKGPGVTKANNLAVFHQEPGAPSMKLFGTGEAIPELGGGEIQKWFDLVQDRDNGAALAAVSFLLKSGPGGVTKADDSGVLRVDDNSSVSRYREGQNDVIDNRSGGTVAVPEALGQFAPRVAVPGSWAAHFTAALQGDPAANQGVFRGYNEPELLARRGEMAANTGGAFFSSFLAETSPDWDPRFRAVLTGPGVTKANNEALFSDHVNAFPNIEPFARKGQEPDPTSEPGVVFSRFLQFWPAGNHRILFLAKLAGPGVNRNNDCALYLSQEDGSFLRLLREGDDACGCDCPRVGSILRVSVDGKNGHYAVLTSLVGGSRTGNLALWAGHAGADMNFPVDQALRLPSIRLRKGTAYQRATGQTTSVKSFTFPQMTDAGGAGGKGNGQVIGADGTLALTLEFTNRGREVLVGRP